MRDIMKGRRASRARWAACGVLFAALAGVVGSSGCSASAASICDRMCECEGCSKSQRDACLASFDTTEKLANDRGCSDLEATWRSCIDEYLVCVDDDVDIDACETEEKALAKCMKATASSNSGG